MKFFIVSFLILLFVLPLRSSANEFKPGKGTFILDNKPFLVKAAELHYPRIPEEYWEQRIQLCKALGMNTICLYTFWNIHEPKEGEFDFSGNNDIRKFIQLCDENGMKVILRPGPYVCAEWEMGGLPWWLLKNKNVSLRDNDPYFLEKVRLFEEKVAGKVADLTIENGGPIIMIQVENEYGSYGENKEYIKKIRDILRENYGDEILLFQCDWSSNFTLNGLEDLIWTMNFGTGADIESQFEELKRLRPDSPLMCSEFWSGWFDKWGVPHETRSADEMIAGIDEMLSKGISFSLYMTHGGTNWGHWAGANSPGYSPDVTSYDYDAPINENGQPTPKYWLLRETMSKYLPEGEKLEELPSLITPIKIPPFELQEVAPLWENIPASIKSENLKTFEELDMGFGSLVYSTILPEIETATVIKVNEPHDFAQLFINNEKVGTLDRRKGETEIVLGKYPEGSKLDILIEATGRINFGKAIKDFKGITESVTLTFPDGHEDELTGWEIAKLPDDLDFYKSLDFIKIECVSSKNENRLPAGVYKGSFNLDSVSDTFLNFEKWGKGLVYINGYGIGRIWDIGPQQTLYVPGPWLRQGENEILIFDIIGPSENIVFGSDMPELNKLTAEKIKHESPINLTETTPFLSYSFNSGNGWKEVIWENPVKGRFLCLEAVSNHDNSNDIAAAELYLLDKNKKRISREKWSAQADSQDLASGNHTADKIFDLQESTFWKTETGSSLPHYIIIDLGDEYELSGLQYLPRMEKDAPGELKDFRLYVSDKNFAE